MSFLREKEIEKKLILKVKKEGGICIKLVSPSFDGLPDRMVLLSNRKIGFIELKAPNKKPRPLQIKRMNDLRKLGFKCFVVDRTEQIGDVINEIYST